MRPVRAAFLAGLFYVALTLALTYPLVTDLGRFVPSDPGDPLLNTWILWWNAQTVPLTTAWWNAPAFYPSPDALALSEHLLGQTPFSSPVIWLTGNPQLAYNITFLLTFVLSGMSAYALGFVLTGRSDAALLAGLAYAFAPYRMAQFPHIQVLSSYWMPAALAALHLYLREGRRLWLAAFVAAALWQGLSMGYYLLFFPVLVGLWTIWFGIAGRRWQAVAAISVAFAASCLAAAPILAGYMQAHRALDLGRGIGEIAAFSADVTSLLAGEPNLAFWQGVLRVPSPEAQLFPGITVIVMILAALLFSARGQTASREGRPVENTTAASRIGRRLQQAALVIATVLTLIAIALPIFGGWQLDLPGLRISVQRISRPISAGLVFWLIALALSPRARSVARSQSAFSFYIVATLVMWLLAFGPHPTFDGQRVLYWAPYRWLMLLPGFDGVRVPARFGMLAALTLAAAASIAFTRLRGQLPTALRPALLGVAAMGLVADGWISGMPLATPPVASLLTPQSPPGSVLELPVGEMDVAAMYRGMTHRHPVVNGYSGYSTPFYDLVRAGIETRDPDVLPSLARLGVRHVMVLPSADPVQTDWNAYVRNAPGVTLVDTMEGQTHYTLQPGPPRGSEVPPLHAGSKGDRQLVNGAAPRQGSNDERPLAVASITAGLEPGDLTRLIDGDLETAWETGVDQTGGPAEVITIDLPGLTSVSGVDMVLGKYRTSYPRELVVEGSADCRTWQPLWQGSPLELALSAVLEDPSRTTVRLRFAPVEARCLALRQVGAAAAFHWAIAELVLRGAPPRSATAP